MILQNQRLLAEICDNTGALVRLRPLKNAMFSREDMAF